MDQVAVTNVALGYVGFQPITGIDDPQKHAQLCKTLYPALLGSLLEERQWSFAVQRLELAPEELDAAEKTALAPFTARFLLPTTVARVLTVGDGSGRDLDDWQLEGTAIVTAYEGTKVYAKVLVKGDQVERFSPAFEQALAARLAAEIAPTLTENQSLHGSLWQLYDRKLRAAAALDGMQGRAERPSTNYFRDRRR